MRKAIVLAWGVGLALMGWTANVPNGAVAAWWRFDNPDNVGFDSSGYGNHLNNSKVDGSNVKVECDAAGSSGTYDGSASLWLASGKSISGSATTSWDTSSGYTYAMKFKADCNAGTYQSDPNVNAVLSAINDKDSWHFIAFRYDPSKLTGKSGSEAKNWLFADYSSSSANGRAEASGDYDMYFPLSNQISVGGKIGACVIKIIGDRSTNYKGYVDDVIVIARTLSKNEIIRLYLTGEAYVYLTGNSSSAFGSSSGWSSNEYNLHLGPADIPGADFIVDSERTLTVSASGTFGGHSLTFGRIEPLKSVIDGSTIATANGNFKQQASVTVGDLRLNSGKLTASAGKTLTATKLTVNATAANPYIVEVASGSYAVTGAAVGGGWMAKTGAGTLDLSGLTGAAKVRLDAGTLKAAKLDGFTDGTVLVSKGSTVAFTGEGTLPTAENKMQILLDGEKPTAKTAVMTVPSGVTAAMIRDTTDYGTGWAGSRVTVENGTVYVEPVKDIRSEVTTTEKVGLAYNRLDVGVTLATPGATGVKVVLMDGQGATVATETAEFTDGAANVGFRDLTPGETYQYDVFLVGGESEVPPTDWETVSKELFKSVDWFGFASGAFLKATPDANIVVADEMYASSKDDVLGLVTPNAAPIEGERTVIEMQVEVAGAYAWNDLPALEGKQLSFGLVLKEGETADTPANRVWAYKLGAGNWTALPSSTAPVADGTYDLRAVLDYRAGHKVASCTLTADSVDYELFSNVPLTADRMNRVGVIGGSVACQNAAYPCIISPTEVEPKGTEIELDASAAVDLAKLTAGTAYTVKDNGYALCWTDAGGRYATKSGNTLTAHEGVPANGLESFTSHALGLDPTDELDKPAAVVKEGGMQAADGVTVHVPNVVRGNLPDAGVEVLFQRQKSADGGKTWTDDGAAVSVGGDLKIPFDGNLYRVNTVLR